MIRKAIHCKKDKKAQQENEKQQKQLDEADDYQSVWQIFKGVIAEGDTYTFQPDAPRDTLEEYWFGPDVHPYVYENEQGEVVGSYRIKPNQVGLGSHIANASFMVHPKYQGQGIGQLLCQHCLKMARELGFKAMQFNIVVCTNLAAIAIYQKFGFKIIGTIPEAFNHLKLGKLVDAHIMYKKL